MLDTLHLFATRLDDVRRAAEILREGGVVAFPTETVYGLGANAFSRDAVLRIFEAKQRPSWDPLIVHVAEPEQIRGLVEVTDELAARVALLGEAFWPGPLTLLLPRAAAIPDEVTAGRAKVGIRVPSHPIARSVLRMAGLPIAAPSANRFGHVSPTTAQHVLDDLGGRIDAVLDGGPTSVGVESTVLDPTVTPMLIYRAGAVTPEEIAAVTGVAVEIFRPTLRAGGEIPEALPSPGVGIRHYAPEARLILSLPDAGALQEEVEKVRGQTSQVIGILLPRDWQLSRDADMFIEPWGEWADPASLAAGLFAGLRALEQLGVDVILCPLPEEGGLLDAVRDRLLKAARPR